MLRRSLLLLAVSVAAAQSPAPAPFFFLQLTDPQFGMYTANRDFAQETANFEFAIAAANRLRPAFVIVTGDLVNRPGDPAQVAEYKRIAARLDSRIPLYNVAGNHDVGNEPTPASLATWRASFGPDYYAFRAGPMAGFVLDSCLQKAPRGVADEAARQEAWLRTELEKARREGVKHLVVFQHHSFFLDSPEEPEKYFNIAPETRRRYLDLLGQYGVAWVFAGHLHRNAEARAGSLAMVTTGPVGKPLDGGKSGIRVVTLEAGGLAHRYYDFSDLPAAIGPARADKKR
jgi:3',5'-cyclic AMP phosphodiesterase CpdA